MQTLRQQPIPATAPPQPARDIDGHSGTQPAVEQMQRSCGPPVKLMPGHRLHAVVAVARPRVAAAARQRLRAVGGVAPSRKLGRNVVRSSV